MRELRLSQNKVTLVDDEDYDNLMRYNWYYHKTDYNEYAMTRRYPNKPLFLHRYLLSPDKNLVIDHIDRNGLNNQRYNLRICTSGINNQNKKITSNNTTGYRGVFVQYTKYSGPSYRARIAVNGKRLNVGTFLTAEQAARAYDIAALNHYGPNAALNFPLEIVK